MRIVPVYALNPTVSPELLLEAGAGVCSPPLAAGVSGRPLPCPSWARPTFWGQRGEDGVLGGRPPHVLQDLLHRGRRRAGGQHHTLLGLGAHPYRRNKGRVNKDVHRSALAWAIPLAQRTSTYPPCPAPRDSPFSIRLHLRLSFPAEAPSAAVASPGCKSLVRAPQLSYFRFWSQHGPAPRPWRNFRLPPSPARPYREATPPLKEAAPGDRVRCGRRCDWTRTWKDATSVPPLP